MPYLKKSFFIIVLLLASCAKQDATLPNDPSPSETIPPECYGYKEIDNAYCGYAKETASQSVVLDIEISGTALPYNEDFAYFDLAAFKDVAESFIMPVKRDMCEVCSDKAIGEYGYAGAWCDCEKLSNELFCYDSKQMLEIFAVDGPLSDSDVKICPGFYDCDIGIAYQDTMLYEILKQDLEFHPLPSCYANISFLNHSGQYQQQKIEKIITDKNRRNHNIIVTTIETEDAYFIEFENSNNGSYRILVYGLKA